jgi:hypothetical protein
LVEWKPEAPWSFRQRLASPIRPELPTSCAPVPPHHVGIDSTWCLAVEGEGPPLTTAAEEIQRFLQGAGVILQPASSTADGPRLELKAAGEATTDAFSIRVSPQRIVVEAEGPRGVLRGVFAIEEEMARVGGPWLPKGSQTRTPFLQTRILRSFWSPYYIDELTTDEEYYPDGYLETLSRYGMNGIWLHGYLQELVPSSIFPEFGQDALRRLRKLNDLITRAARYGIDVFVYFCEPKALALDDPFWERHPEVAGRSAKGNPMDAASEVRSICTSTPEGRAYIEDAYYTLFRQAPGLGGVILITASENHSHCVSHGGTIDCPRCAERKPDEIVAELVGLVNRGVHRANPRAQVIAWTWSWRALAPDPQEHLIGSLPRDVKIMSDFERGAEITRGGKTYPLDEYSMSYIGPSPRFCRQAKIVTESGRTMFAKMQSFTTHELVTVPYYPVPWRLAQKWHGLKEQQVQGIMACWIFGNYPCFTMEVARELSFEPHPPLEVILRQIARRIFGNRGVEEALVAWQHFGDAFEHYPFSIPLLYDGPMNRAPSLPWTFPSEGKPMTPSWRPGPPGDSVENWTVPFGPALVQQCFEAVLAEWGKGLELLDKIAADQLVDADGKPSAAGQEWIVAHAFATHIRSTVHFLRYGQARDAYEKGVDLSPTQRHQHLATMRQAIQDEVLNRRAYLPLVRADSRLGYHSEVEDYFFTASTLAAGIEQLEQLEARIRAEIATLDPTRGRGEA